MFYKYTSLIDGTVKAVAKELPNSHFLVAHADGNTEQSDSAELIEESYSCSKEDITEQEFKTLFTKFIL